MVHLTRGLRDALLDVASERDPSPVTVGLTVTPAGDLSPPVDVDASTPVFTHFYLPHETSVDAVFGIDLGTPRTQGRFVSHPDGDPTLDETDDLHEVVFVAVPPWESVLAYDRGGSQLETTVLTAAPPVETVS